MNPQEKPLVIPIFIPHSGCPHQCAFCNQSIIAQKVGSLPDHSEIQEIVQHYLKFKGRRKKVEIAFFGGNFLGLAPRMIVGLLDQMESYVREKMIDGIRFSTRPDTVTKQRLELIAP